ncbi:WD40/YVTN/BNR-like repeat-containing protein [Bacillus sp. NPDC077027]|uniref:WD40/YVTN/BNR-like repeat-containing protein n=1 Tax=Bacillus sp. NPDC077027 TaxID=3390548 RepID=UPI003D05DDEB
MFHKGATAVVASNQVGYFVAVKREGIFHYSYEQGWHQLLKLKHKIHAITYIGPYLFGVGENGTVIRSSDQGATWAMSSFPTNAVIWSITGNDDGFVCAHGKHSIYISNDFGISWEIMKPFEHIDHPPVIRSLCLAGKTLYIGTQIHELHGGIWSYDLQTETILLINREEHRMTASMLLYNELWLVCALGSKKGRKGAVQVLNLHTNVVYDIQSQAVVGEESFLDVSEDNGIIYVTTSQDEYGFSKVYQLDVHHKELKWFDIIKGHGFRVANQNENFFCAGLYESKFVRPYEESALIH